MAYKPAVVSVPTSPGPGEAHNHWASCLWVAGVRDNDSDEPSCVMWKQSTRADPAARVIADRHYNRQKPGSPQFVPPGRCLVLIADDESAVWVTSYPYAEYVKHAWAGAMVNSLFRNEGRYQSSDLIREAVERSMVYWSEFPTMGIVSFVDAAKVRPKRHPGYCYLMAGWTHVGYTKSGLYTYQWRV